ncbi:helix-turn-helix domain-containing protein, partial [bacterium]|nr:helix-turn-helix domain-containing protein [bacterium]
MKEKDIVMRVKEVKRLRVIEEATSKQMTQRKAASILGLSERQVRRMVKKVAREGPIGIIHCSRNKPSNRKIPEQLKEKVVSLYQKTYSDFGPNGVPQSLYLDKHTTYKSNAKLTIEEELEGKREPKSQFERALEELGVEVIHAN